MSAGSKAWDFVVGRHGEPGVEAACLALQDAHDQCVALLMWRAWTLGEGLRVTPGQLEQAVETTRIWNREVIAPLRAVRRRAGRPLPGLDEAGRRRLRQGLLEQELAGERALIEALAALVPAAPTAAGPGPDRPAASHIEALAETARLWGGSAPDDLLAKLAGA